MPCKIADTLSSESPLLSVGVQSADMMSLGRDLEVLENAGVKILHFDIMDGMFCPGFTFGPGFVKSCRTGMFKDVHLMVDNPLDKIQDFVQAGADMITVHAESTKHVHRALQALGNSENTNDPQRGIIRGVALNPGTPVSVLLPLLDEVEMVCFIAVNPGWSGQSFIDSTFEKIARFRKMADEYGRNIIICVDGGIKKDNIAAAAANGADLIISGSAVFKGDPAANAAEMAESARKAYTRK